MESSHIISQSSTLLEALARINTFKVPEPLVLFVFDDQQRMVGTLTDGDSRRALIAGAAVTDKAEKVMQRHFLYMRLDDITNFEEKLLKFKDDFGRNYDSAHSHFNKAIDEIDKTIDHLQKVKTELLGSDNQLRIANNTVSAEFCYNKYQ